MKEKGGLKNLWQVFYCSIPKLFHKAGLDNLMKLTKAKQGSEQISITKMFLNYTF